MKQQLKTVYIPLIDDTEEFSNTILCDSQGGFIENLEEKKLIIFTQEEYNKHIKDVIEKALDYAAIEATTKFCGNPYDYEDQSQCVDKSSITITLLETFNKFKI
jgi:hypothetical protein